MGNTARSVIVNNAEENAINTAVDQLWEALELSLEEGNIQETDVFELSGDLHIHGRQIGRRLALKCKEYLEERYEDDEEPLCPECHAGIMQPTHIFRETHGERVATRITCDNENCQNSVKI